MRTRIKICGITNIEDALAACELGADAIGFVFAESPRKIAVEDAKRIVHQIPPFVQTVGVFTSEGAEVFATAVSANLELIQLHGDQSEEFSRSLGRFKVIRAVRVKDERSLKQLKEWHSASTFLLDTWSPDQKGGTGTSFNWDLALKAKNSGKAIILAGGLNPSNIAEAIRTVRPHAVDVSSGVEAQPGKKDLTKLKEFIDNVRAADAIS